MSKVFRFSQFMKLLHSDVTHRFGDVAAHIGSPEFIAPSRNGSNLDNCWGNYVDSILREVQAHPADFLRQPSVSRILHPAQQELAWRYLHDLSGDDFSRVSILPYLHDVPFGNPYLCTFFPLCSPLSLQHAYYCMLMKKAFNIFLPDNTIQTFVDFGGGYGNFCRLMRSFGYKGKYYIYDIPEMHLVQQHYLKNVLSNCEQATYIDSFGDDKFVGVQQKSLFMATFSLNETSLATRSVIEKELMRFDYIFIAYNRNFESVDNIAYFSSFAEKIAEIFSVRIFKDEYRSAWYLTAEKKEHA